MQHARDCFFCELPVYLSIKGFSGIIGNLYHYCCFITVASDNTRHKIKNDADKLGLIHKPVTDDIFSKSRKTINQVKKLYSRADKEGIKEYHERIEYCFRNTNYCCMIEKFEHFQYVTIIHPEYSGIMIPPSIIELIRDYTFEGCD